ncbi:hypothetical protein D3C76_1730180 [compost metagenome]
MSIFVWLITIISQIVAMIVRIYVDKLSPYSPTNGFEEDRPSSSFLYYLPINFSYPHNIIHPTP